jgi:hypothetical protein
MKKLLEMLGVKALDEAAQDKIKQKLNEIVDFKVKQILNEYGIKEGDKTNTSSSSSDFTATISAYQKMLNEMDKTSSSSSKSDKVIDKKMYKWDK